MLRALLTIGCMLITTSAMALDVTMAVVPMRPPVIDGSVTFYPGTAHERMVVGPGFHTVFDIVTDTSVSLTRLSLKVTSAEGLVAVIDLPLNGAYVQGGGTIKFTDIFGDKLPKSKSYEYSVESTLFGVIESDSNSVFESKFSFKTQ